MEPELPLEFLVRGTPVGFRASTHSREAWKREVRQAARAVMPEGAWALATRLEVTIFFFPAIEMAGDIDNRIKPILDALSKLVYVDDELVDRLVVQRFELSRPCQILDPTATLITAIGADGPIVYIRLDDNPNRERTI